MTRREERTYPSESQPPDLRNWIKQAEFNRGEREGLSTEEREELRSLRRKNRILREEREILKKVAAFFANEAETQ